MTTAVLGRRSNLLTAVVAFAAAAAAAAIIAAASSWPFGSAAPAARPVSDWFAPIAKSYGDNPRIARGFDFASLYASYPRWFEGIAKAYHYNPAITPGFDFASLYAAPRS